VPGCPPRPDAIILGVAKAAEILAERGNKPPAESVMVPIVDANSDSTTEAKTEGVQA
jgi:NADH:ubiquinone oxidoreductase subunit B-like Fe-S oxidoreductase